MALSVGLIAAVLGPVSVFVVTAEASSPPEAAAQVATTSGGGYPLWALLLAGAFGMVAVLVGRPLAHAAAVHTKVGARIEATGGFGGIVRRALHRKLTWFLGVPTLLAGGLAIGALMYVHNLNANVPPPLGFASDISSQQTTGTLTAPSNMTPSAAPKVSNGAPAPRTKADVAPPPVKAAAAAPAAGQFDGRWVVGKGSVAGYRWEYSSPLGSGTRVGRSQGAGSFAGEISVSGKSALRGTFKVDFRKVFCDAGSQCDSHVREIMDTEHYPFETFTFSKPINVSSIPADGKQIVVNATGQFTLRGVTRSITFPLAARSHGGHIEVVGTISVNRDDYKIPDSDEPGFNIAKNGKVEFMISFDRAQ